MTENKHLLIKGLAGFGNRLLTLSAAIEYAKKTNRKIIVDWCDNMYAPEGENSFYKIFKPKVQALSFTELDIAKADAVDVYPKMFKGRIEERLYNLAMPHKVVDSFKNPIVRILGKKVLGNSFFVKIHHEVKAHQLLNSNFAFPYGKNLNLKLPNKTIIYGDFIHQKGFKWFLETFEFIQPIQERILTKLKPDNARLNNGFHIRGTDFGEDLNTVKRLIKRLKTIFVNNEPFYLATDSKSIKALFLDSFGNSVITNDSELPDTNGVGIHNYLRKQSGEHAEQSRLDLVEDMVNLISVKQFYGHNKSTLSSFINEYRIGKVEGSNSTWDRLISNSSN